MKSVLMIYLILMMVVLISGCNSKTEETQKTVETCVTQRVTGGSMITCGDTSSIVYDGTTPSIVEIVGTQVVCSKKNDSLVALRLADGTLLLLKNYGKDQDDLVSLEPGDYMIDLDHKKCKFMVTSRLEIIKEGVDL